MQIKPDWIPNWQNESEYPDPETTTHQQWAWEFLRRSSNYRRDYSDFEDMIESDILKQAERGSITDNTARIVIKHLQDNGKDSLMPNLKGDIFDGGNESTLLIPPAFDDHLDMFAELEDNWNKPIPEVKEPSCSKRIREYYSVASPQDPANNKTPIFVDQFNAPFVSIALSHDSLGLARELQPENEYEIAFMVDQESQLKIKFHL